MEANLPSIDLQVWARTFNYWLQLNLAPTGLLTLVQQDHHESAWTKTTIQKLYSLGLSPQHLLTMGLSKAKNLIRQRLLDIEQQNNLATIRKFCPWYD